MVLDELGRAKETAKSFARSEGAIKKAPERKRLDSCAKAIHQFKNYFSSLDPFLLTLQGKLRTLPVNGTGRMNGILRPQDRFRRKGLGDVEVFGRVA